MDLTKYEGKNGVSIRNLLTTETDLEILLVFAMDSRRIVSDKATGRIRALGTEVTPAEGPSLPFPTAPDLTKLPELEAADDDLTDIGRAALASHMPEPISARPSHRPPEPVKTQRRKTAPASEPVAAPAPVAEVAGVRPLAKAQPAPEGGWADQSERICPKCGGVGTVLADFGWRRVPAPKGGTKLVPQPWCKPCRSGAAAQSRTAPKRAGRK